MSWDLFVQDWGNVKSLKDIPDDFEPKPLGKRSEIIDQIIKLEPKANFTSPEWGIIENNHFTIEFNLGENEILYSFVIHVNGDEFALLCIDNLLRGLGLKAADGSSPNFFEVNQSKEIFNKWIEYRNQILNK